MKYRPEIDGLRAIAVVPVVLFHAGFKGFSGGYVGVDVFFVISGYLITSIILSDRAKGTFTLLGFYERRARRIFPALFFVILSCLPLAWLWMTPSALASFSVSVAATAAFCNNIALMFASGYFSPWVEEKLLLHTWSLGVEEQFYIVFPLFLVFCLRFGKRGFVITATGVALLSFSLAEYGSRHFIDFNFYSSVTRGWELLIGAFIAVYLWERTPRDSRVGNWVSLVGVLLIVCSIFAFDRSTPFPGVFALVPTVGTALVILFASANSLAKRLLSIRVLVGIGLISYSAYLWHQPLLALARLRLVNEPSTAVMALLSAATFVLAYGTWRFVEQPFRHRSDPTQKRFLAAVLSLTSALVVVGLIGYLEGGFRGRFRGEAADAAAAMEDVAGYKSGVWKAIGELWSGAPAEEISRGTATSTCIPAAGSTPSEFSAVQFCSFGSPAGRPVFVIGDSHAGTLVEPLADRFRSAGFRGLLVSNGYCQPIPYLYERGFEGDKTSPGHVSKCMASQEFLLRQIEQFHPAAIVVLIRWTARLFPAQPSISALTYDNGEGGVEHAAFRETFAFDGGKLVQSAQSKRNAVHRFIKELLDMETPVILVYPVPETGWHIPRRNFKEIAFGAGRSSTISTSYSKFLERNAFAISILDSVENRPNLFRVRPADRLCNTYIPNRCIAQFNAEPLYFDENHLTSAGVELFVDDIMSPLR